VTSVDCVLRAVEALDALGVPYMLVGSFSSNYYGRARSTEDADFVVELSAQTLPRLAEALSPEFALDRQMAFETITGSMRYVATHGETAFKIEFFLVRDDPYNKGRFARRQPREFEGRRVWLPTAEDVVVTKLRWGVHGRRQKDIDDVAAVMAVQFHRLDMDYVRRWCDEFGTRSVLEQILGRVVGA
jgi:hypothetical protein